MHTNRQGLSAMQEQLGITRYRLLAGIGIIGIFEVTIIGFAVLQAWCEYRFAWPPVAVYTVFWVIWTFWHSWLFLRNRLHYLVGEHPYRRAFVFDIYPWVSAGFSQMWRPMINGDTLGRLLHGNFTLHPASVTAGMLICVVSLLIIIQAIRDIGIHNAAFMGEFVDSESFVLLRNGIYKFVTHPLFWSGIAYSVGLAISISTRTAYEIAGVNVLYGVVYHCLEDRRLEQIFGASYKAYRRGFAGSVLDARDGKIS